LVAGEIVEFPPLAPAFHAFFLIEWNELIGKLRGEAQVVMIDVALRLGVARVAVNKLISLRPKDRLLAILTIGNLRLRAAMPLLVSIANGQRGLASLSALRAMTRIDAQQTLEMYALVMLHRDDWPMSLLLKIVKEGHHCDTCGIFSVYLNVMDDRPLVQLLTLLENLNCMVDSARLWEVFENAPSIEVKGRCLRLMHDPSQTGLLRTCMASDKWLLRMNAVRAYARFATLEDIGLLLPLLSDREWWVRYRTAQTLYQLPGMTVDKLRAIQAELGDNYAKNILDQVIAEAEYT
ncbi:MAG: hypothetical protein OEW08_07885, partial [Gammaproteobacteria bacterium]|nr:hypothetical protein [Gammaproteobacteria bacterium]